MNKNDRSRYIAKVTFVCTSAVLSLWLGSNYFNQTVKAADSDQTVQTQITQDVKQNENTSEPKELSDTQTVKDETKVVIHYDGDGSKWDPYLWGKKPNGSGQQYQWEGKDDYGYYTTVDLNGSYSEVGALIKGKDSWDKDGQGQDRTIDVAANGKGEVWYKEGIDEAQQVTPEYKQAKINIHYHGNASANAINVWTDKDSIKIKHNLNGSGKESETGSFDLSSEAGFSKIFASPVDDDTLVSEFTPLPGNGVTDIYLVAGDKIAYYTKSASLKQESLSSASMENANTVIIESGKAMTADEAKANLAMNGNTITNVEAVNADAEGKSLKFKITTKEEMDLMNNNEISFKGNMKQIDIGNYVRSKEFDDKYYYSGDDLGANYTEEQTIIKLWSPVAKEVTLNLYDNLDNNSKASKSYKMVRGDKGVWSVSLPGDYKNWSYDYSLTFGNGKTSQSNDPYSKAVTVNGERTVIEDYDAIKPNNFSRMPAFSQPTNAIIYETSVRDFTSDKNSGIKDKGKYLGMIEPGVTADGQITGLDYLKSLGVTHVQLMPMYDFASLDETSSNLGYNWGYDPKNYNVPEGIYSSDAKNPTARIIEMKQMIDGLHKAGIRVIMDVVYNHVYNADEQALNKTVPGYYFQYDAEGHSTNGTGCGNDVASERKMARKYIVDSVKYWAKNYNIDGFRFDLMGILDVDTMNEVRAELNKIDPSILVYGEGWDMRQTNHDIGAGQYNADKVDKGIGFFSDDIRNAIKGAEFGGLSKGLVEGNGQEANYETNARNFIDGFLGGQNYGKTVHHPYQIPSQTINYVACHDNRTLYDMIKALMPDESEENIIKRDKLATSMAMLAQGIPFVHAGQESLQTKNGNENSYNAPVEVNEINWKRVKENSGLVDYFKELVNLRKSEAAFRQDNYGQIDKSVKVVNAGDKGVFAFEYISDNGRKLLVTFNVNDAQADFDKIDLSGKKKLLDSDGQTELGKDTSLMPLSTLVVELEAGKSEEKFIVPDENEHDHVDQPTINNDVTSVIDNNTNSSVSNPAQNTKQITLTHKAYVYQKDGITRANNLVLKVGTVISAWNNGQAVMINNKKFYQIGENQFIKAANTISRKILIHNSFVYNRQGKAVRKNHKRVLLKKNKIITPMNNGQITTIKGKQFYQIGENKFVKVVNTRDVR